jgi:enediyne biosynthesis protein E4
MRPEHTLSTRPRACRGVLRRVGGLLVMCALLAACRTPDPEPLLSLLKPDESGILFKNMIWESDTMNVVRFTNIYNGGGVGIGDFDADGRPDLFLPAAW